MRLKKFFSIIGLLCATALAGCAGDNGRGFGGSAYLDQCNGKGWSIDAHVGGPQDPCPRRGIRGRTRAPGHGAPAYGMGGGYPISTHPPMTVRPQGLPQPYAVTTSVAPNPNDPTGAQSRQVMTDWTHRALRDDPSIPVEITETVSPVKPGYERLQAIRNNGVWYTHNRGLPLDFGPPD